MFSFYFWIYFLYSFPDLTHDLRIINTGYVLCLLKVNWKTVLHTLGAHILQLIELYYKRVHDEYLRIESLWWGAWFIQILVYNK